MLNRLDFWLAAFTLALLGWIEFERFVRPIGRGVLRVFRMIWSLIAPAYESEPNSTRSSTSNNMSSTRSVSTGIAGITPGTAVDIAQLACDLTEDQLLELLLRRKRTDGEWRFSGKKLFTIWGGNYNAFVARSMAVRAGDDPPEEPLVPTPIAGRPTKASYYQDTDLEYQPPPR